MRHRTRPTCRIVNGEPVWRFRCDCGEIGPSHTGPDAFERAKADERGHTDSGNPLRVDWSVVEGWLR